MLIVLFTLLFVSNFVPKLYAAECTNDISTSNCRLLMENGHCLTNDDVKESCKQTCGVCFSQEDEDKLEDTRTCRDLSTNCQTYKSRCTQNTYSNQMKRLCPKTCNFDFCRSGTKNSNSKCEDYNKENCRALKDRCTDNADILKEYCPVTCNLCNSTDENSNGDCEDKSEQCNRFKRYCNSQDQEVREVLRNQCASTCNFCDSNSKNSECKDTEQFCMLIKALGPQNYCSSNNYSTKCPKSCGTCSSNGVSNINNGPCYDEFTACAELKQNNLCNQAFIVSEMRKKCRLTCGFCGTNNRLQMRLFGWSSSEPKEEKKSFSDRVKGLFGSKKSTSKDDDKKKTGLFGSLFGKKKDSASSDEKEKKTGLFGSLFGSNDDDKKKTGLFGSLFGNNKTPSNDKKSTSNADEDETVEKPKSGWMDAARGLLFGKQKSADGSKNEDSKSKWTEVFSGLLDAYKNSRSGDKSKDCDETEESGWKDFLNIFNRRKPCSNTKNDKNSKDSSSVKNKGWFDSLFGRKEPKSDADKLLEELSNRKKPTTSDEKSTNDDRSLLDRLLGRRKPSSSSSIDDLLKEINDGKTNNDDRSLLDRLLGRKKPNTTDEKKSNPSLEDLLNDARKKPNSKKKSTADTLLEQLTNNQKKNPNAILDNLRRRKPTSQTTGNVDLSNLFNFPNSANNQLGSSPNCFDSQPQACADWVSRGMCSSPTVRQEIKMQYCARSCNLC